MLRRVSHLPLFGALSVALHLFLLPWLVVPTVLRLEPAVPIEVERNDHMADIDLDVGPGREDLLVKTEAVNNAETPAKSKLLSDRNQTVAQEEQAKYGHQFSAGGEGLDVFDPKQAAQLHGVPPESLSLTDLSLDGKPGGTWRANPKFLARVFEGAVNTQSASNDSLPDVPLGMRTLLNTKEYRFHLYLDRIRQNITQPWRQEVERRLAALFVNGQHVTAGKDLITKLTLTLDAKGAVTSTAVVKSSGSRTIDLAGETVFRKAAVFPNPPKGIEGEDGVIHLRWTFVLKVVPQVADVAPTTSGSDQF